MASINTALTARLGEQAEGLGLANTLGAPERAVSYAPPLAATRSLSPQSTPGNLAGYAELEIKDHRRCP
jgi:hypothetical protein